MSEFKGTKGKWIVERVEDTIYDQEVFAISTPAHKEFITVWNGVEQLEEEQRANALIISKAPEMLEKLKQAKSELSRIKGSMMAHPDCTEGSEFDDYTSSAERMENEIENLIKEATTI